jgi:hypothetical protein
MKIKTTLFALAILASFLACQWKENKVVSDELAGVWKTSAPKYKDCSLELNEHFIMFVNGQFLENIDVNFISNIENTRIGTQVLYDIYYENLENQEFKLSFFYDPSNGGVIRFKNQQKIEWRKGNYPEYLNHITKIPCSQKYFKSSTPDLRRRTSPIVDNEFGSQDILP